MPIQIPDGVTVKIVDTEITAESSGKRLSYRIPQGIIVRVDGSQVILEREQDTPRSRSLQGLSRTLINNMVIGVKEGFKKRLELVGRGKRAKVEGKALVLEIGLSHPVRFELPPDIQVKVEKNIIELSGIDKQKVGEAAAEIRDIQSPEPYKGAGIRYEGEYIRKKAGKSAVGGGFTGTGK